MLLSVNIPVKHSHARLLYIAVHTFYQLEGVVEIEAHGKSPFRDIDTQYVLV